MRFTQLLQILVFVFSFFYYFDAKGQQSGYYVIPPELQGIISTNYLDSLRAKLASQPKTFLHIDYESLGTLLWTGGTGLKCVPDSSNKLRGTIYSCTEYGWIKTEVQFDTSNQTKDYEIHTACYNVSGDVFWTEFIELDVIDISEIIINTPIDVTVEIYTAYSLIRRSHSSLL